MIAMDPPPVGRSSRSALMPGSVEPTVQLWFYWRTEPATRSWLQECLSSDREIWRLQGKWRTLNSIRWALPLQPGYGSVLLDQGWAMFFRIAQSVRVLMSPRQSSGAQPYGGGDLLAVLVQQTALQSIRNSGGASCFAPSCSSVWTEKYIVCPAPLRGIWCCLANTQHWFL